MMTDNQQSHRDLPLTGLLIAIFVVSAAALSYQVALTRIFSISQWHHFAHMIISLAMLGFAAAGTFLAFCKSSKNNLTDWLKIVLLLTALSFPLSYWLSSMIPFETFRLTTQPVQLLYLLTVYLVLALPFFLASSTITIGFLTVPHKIGLVYFSNMLGSGAGALFTVGFLFFLPVYHLPYTIALFSSLPVFLLFKSRRAKQLLAVILFTAIVITLFVGIKQIPISQYKPLSYALQNPDAEIVARETSPLSEITAVRSSMIRETPGQISNYPYSKYGSIPEQIVLYFDGGSPSPIINFTGDTQPISYLDHTTSALPFHLDLPHDRVAVIGAGGGGDILLSLYHGAEDITAIEVDPSVHKLLAEDFAKFSGNLYHNPKISYLLEDGRGYLQKTPQTYELIKFPLLDAFTATAAGTNALAESYLYTREAIHLYLDRLTERGCLSFTRWLRTPPRDFIKLLATVIEVLDERGVENPGEHLLAIRSWNTGTLVVSPTAFSQRSIHQLQSFADDRWFDLIHHPTIESAEVNRFIVLKNPDYYNATQALLSPQRASFLAEHQFNLNPPEDNRPYFHHFFRWHSFIPLWKQLGSGSMRYLEWGYVILLATILQAGLTGILFILIPLWLLRSLNLLRPLPWIIIAYFAGLGLAYIFLEMVLIQRFMLFLNYPIYAIAVVLTALLCFSGGGSYLAHLNREFPFKTARTAIIVILLTLLLYQFSFPLFFDLAAGWSDFFKILSSLLLLAPLAFAMGIPFPLGLQLLASKNQSLIPWAWAINGSFSVIGAGLATLLSVHLGFSAVIFISGGCYLIVLLLLRLLISYI